MIDRLALVVVAAKFSVIPPFGWLDGREKVSTLTPPFNPLNPFNETFREGNVILSTVIPNALTLRPLAEISHSNDSCVSKVYAKKRVSLGQVYSYPARTFVKSVR